MTLCRTSTLADLERMEFGSHSKRKYPISAMGSFIAALSTVLCTFALLVSTREGRLVDGVMGDLVRFSHVGLAILGLRIFSLASAVSSIWSSSID